jgi:hypothetical protein
MALFFDIRRLNFSNACIKAGSFRTAIQLASMISVLKNTFRRLVMPVIICFSPLDRSPGTNPK